MTGDTRDQITWFSDILLKAAAGVCVALLWFAQIYLRDMAENIEQLKHSVQNLSVETRLVERELRVITDNMERMEKRIAKLESKNKP